MSSKRLFIPFLVLGLCSFFGEKMDAFTIIKSKSWAKSWAQLNDSSWMQKTEVSNAEFRLFLEEMKKAGKEEEYEFFYPDTTAWTTIGEGQGPFKTYYFSHSAYRNYPVVNITFEAAFAYCKWLTDAYARLEKKPFGEVVFCIPDHASWMRAAAALHTDGRRYPWGGLYVYNNRKERLCNFSDTAMPQRPFAGAFRGNTGIVAPVNSFFPNDLGLYNLCGNVAEMVSERGVAAGGGFRNDAYGVRIQSTQTFDKPAPDIGFRVMMVRKRTGL